MATKTADIHIRISPTLKAEAEDYFEKSDVTMSQALEQFLIWTIKHQKTPMRLRKRASIPDLNAMTREETREMIDSAEQEVKSDKYHTTDEVRREMAKRYGFKI